MKDVGLIFGDRVVWVIDAVRDYMSWDMCAVDSKTPVSVRVGVPAPIPTALFGRRLSRHVPSEGFCLGEAVRATSALPRYTIGHIDTFIVGRAPGLLSAGAGVFFRRVYDVDAAHSMMVRSARS